MPEGAVYVGRPTRWGNPFAVMRAPEWPHWAGSAPWVVVDDTGKVWHPEDDHKVIVGRAAADAHQLLLAHQHSVDLFALHIGPMGAYEYDTETRAALVRDLAGRDLSCWCPLALPCHADVLLDLANGARP